MTSDAAHSTPGASSVRDIDHKPNLRPSQLVILINNIGAETVLADALGGIASSTPAAFVAFPDVRKGFSSLLCDKLRSETKLQVRELLSRQTLDPGTVYVVPAQFSLEWFWDEMMGAVEAEPQDILGSPADAVIRISGSCRRAAEIFGKNTTAVMLSGMGGDSFEAIRHIKQAGGTVITQTEATAVIADGPRAVIEANLSDTNLPLWAIGGHLSDILEG